MARLQQAVTEATESGIAHQRDAMDRMQRIRELEQLHDESVKRWGGCSPFQGPAGDMT